MTSPLGSNIMVPRVTGAFVVVVVQVPVVTDAVLTTPPELVPPSELVLSVGVSGQS
jgi:hypothetical protein